MNCGKKITFPRKRVVRIIENTNFRQLNLNDCIVFSFVKPIQSGAQCGNVPKNAITLKKFPWNQFFSNFFRKTVDLTEKMLIFPQKSWSRFTVLFHTVWCKSYKNLLPKYFWKNFVKWCRRSFSQNIFHFTEKKSVEPNFSTIVYAQCELWIDFTKYFSSELVFAYSTMLCISTYVEVLKVDFPFQYRSTDM